MVNIDFVPDDYIQQRQSNKANFMCLVLFAALMGAVAVTFSIIKVRQKAVQGQLNAVKLKLSKAHEQITQLEELQRKRKAMMKTALMTAQLLEPVPKSVILACLTNNLPGGVSLVELKLRHKKAKVSVHRKEPATQYEQAGAKNPKEPTTLLHLEIAGIAPSDIQVASYIARLCEAPLLDNVALVQSKEHEIEEAKFREFKLKATLKKNVQLTKDDITSIRRRHEEIL